MSTENFTAPGVGIDMVDIVRFEKFTSRDSDAFLSKVFFDNECVYCFSHKNPAPHLAGMFACKEAVSKALGVEAFPFSEIEVRHKGNGAPEVFHKGGKLAIKVSITHTDTVAVAIAVL